MEQLLSITNRKKILINTAYFVVLLSVATFAPLINQQFITGPLVNSVLLITAVLLGSQSALMVATIPSIVALSIGLLPAPLAPMVPFIILGNMILVLAFNYLRNKNYWLGIIAGSVLKFGFLWATSSIVIGLLTKSELASKVATMLSWPQLVTAITGGIVAYLLLKAIKKV